MCVILDLYLKKDILFENKKYLLFIFINANEKETIVT